MPEIQTTTLETIKASALQEITSISDSNYIVVTDGVTSKKAKATLFKGANGKSIELQKTSTHIQYRQEGGTWTNLLALADLKGDKGESADVDLTNYATQTWVTQQIANIQGGGSVDLSGYQQKNDETLTTTAKTIVEAINENKSALDTITTRIDEIELDGNLILESVEVGEIFTSVIETIECTNISLTSNLLSFTNTNAQTLTYTLTPSNTTDKVIWSSDKTDIATVNNGVVTPIENGSCVITVTCGSQSATCNVTVSKIVKQYTITNNLKNVSTSNSNTVIVEKSSYTATLTANENYEINTVTITMNGIDITSSAYSDGSINIPNVTGNIVINVNATSTIVGSDILAKIETIDGVDYLVIDNISKIQNTAAGTAFKYNSYSNDTYQVYTATPSFNQLWDKVATMPLITLKNIIKQSQMTSQSALLLDSQEGDLLLKLSGLVYLRLYKDLGGYSTVEDYLETTYGGLKFALISPYNTKEIIPSNITSISVKTNDSTCQYAQFGYTDLPSSNIYSGANSLGIAVGMNANLSTSLFTPTACMSTTTLSIRFNPNTFADFTLDAVKEYLTKNPLIFWY